MPRTYTKKEIAHLVSCSVATVEKDAQHLKLVPQTGDRGLNLYSESDFRLIKQMREHCADKISTRDSFVPRTEVEIVEDEPKVSKLTNLNNSNLIIENYKNSILEASTQDPLFDLELLQRISDNKWMLPAARLAPIFKIGPKYLSSLSQYYYCGFIAIKEVYAGGKALWKVESNNS